MISAAARISPPCQVSPAPEKKSRQETVWASVNMYASFAPTTPPTIPRKIVFSANFGSTFRRRCSMVKSFSAVRNPIAIITP